MTGKFRAIMRSVLVGVAAATAMTFSGCMTQVDDASAEASVGEIQSALSVCPAFDTNIYNSCFDQWDSTGYIQTRLYECKHGDQASAPTAICRVESDFAVVGGGASAGSTTGNGGLLTMSFPAGGSAGGYWFAASKDHIWADPHVVKAYAIGLKIFNQVNGQKVPWAVAPHIQYNWFNSSASQTVGVKPNQHVLLGGGAAISYNGSGVLLTSSYPAGGSGWFAGGKAHVQADTASIYSVVISLPQCPSGLAFCLTSVTNAGTGNTGFGSQGTLFWNTHPQYALTSIGARADGTNQTSLTGGRLLTSMFFTAAGNGAAIATSKDHGFNDSGGTTAFYVGLKRQ